MEMRGCTTRFEIQIQNYYSKLSRAVYLSGYVPSPQPVIPNAAARLPADILTSLIRSVHERWILKTRRRPVAVIGLESSPAARSRVGSPGCQFKTGDLNHQSKIFVSSSESASPSGFEQGDLGEEMTRSLGTFH